MRMDEGRARPFPSPREALASAAAHAAQTRARFPWHPPPTPACGASTRPLVHVAVSADEQFARPTAEGSSGVRQVQQRRERWPHAAASSSPGEALRWGRGRGKFTDDI